MTVILINRPGEVLVIYRGYALKARTAERNAQAVFLA